MTRLIIFLFLSSSIIRLRCLGMTIFAPKVDNEADVNELNPKQPSILIVRLNNHDDDELHRLPNVKIVKPQAEDEQQSNVGEWEKKNKGQQHFQVFKINGRQPANKKVLISRPLILPTHQLFPPICLAGASMFQGCCARLNQMPNSTDLARQLCFHDKCCSNFTTTTPSPANDSELLATTVNLGTAANGNLYSTTISNDGNTIQNATIASKVIESAVQNGQASTKVAIADKRQRFGENKPNLKSSNEVNEGKQIGKTSSTKNVVETEAKRTTETESDTIVGQAASATKLQKMSGKGRNFLSREEVDFSDRSDKSLENLSDDEEVYETIRTKDDDEKLPKTSIEEDSFETSNGSSINKMAATTRSSGKSVKTLFNEEVPEVFDNEEQNVSRDESKSSELLVDDDDVSRSSVESDEDWIRPNKMSRKTQRKLERNLTTRRLLMAKTSLNNVTANLNKQLMTSSATAESVVESATNVPVKSPVKGGVKEVNRLGSNGPVSVTNNPPPNVQQKTKVEVLGKDKDNKGPCPKNKGGPNCSIDITGVISGYGYYVYAHSKVLSRAESVRECSMRNMSLAFLTNHNEDKLLRRLVASNATYWIGLTKQLPKGEFKSRFRWEDGSDAGTYISRYVSMALDGEGQQKSREDASLTTCTLRLQNGKMKVDCGPGNAVQLAYPICMYRPTNVTSTID